jgi:hypothetical protein
MSGIEVVGLVLGALPLVVHGIKGCSETFSTAERLFRPQRELNSLRRQINTELQLFRNTTERLLLNITNDLDTLELLQDPKSDRWKDTEFERKLRTLLGSSYTTWCAVMEDVMTAVTDIRGRLNLPGGNVRPGPGHRFRDLTDNGLVETISPE